MLLIFLQRESFFELCIPKLFLQRNEYFLHLFRKFTFNIFDDILEQCNISKSQKIKLISSLFKLVKGKFLSQLIICCKSPNFPDD